MIEFREFNDVTDGLRIYSPISIPKISVTQPLELQQLCVLKPTAAYRDDFGNPYAGIVLDDGGGPRHGLSSSF